MPDPTLTFTLSFNVAAPGTELLPSTGLFPSGSLYPGVAALPAWMPTPADVGTLLFARTLEAGGTRRLGAFDERTFPTGTMVRGLIADAVQDVQASVGVTLPVSVQPMVKSVIALAAAIQLEVSYYPEQATTDNLAFRTLQDRFTRRLVSLVDAAKDAQDGGDPGGVDDRLMPQFSFPAASQPPELYIDEIVRAYWAAYSPTDVVQRVLYVQSTRPGAPVSGSLWIPTDANGNPLAIDQWQVFD